MAWNTRSWAPRSILGGAAAVAAGAALACERGEPCARYEDRRLYQRDIGVEDGYGPPPPVRAHERRPCLEDCELVLPASFFAGGGGVGPIPSGTYYGGGYVIVGGGAFGGARASSSATASASARVSVRISGGGRVCCH
jgi:hypothetical protein